MAQVQVFQLVGLVWLTDHAVERAADLTDIKNQQWHRMHALLASYAGLEALIMETAIDRLPNLYADEKGFRRKGLVAKFRGYLDASGRSGEKVPDAVQRISDYRIAITHSEPDNNRITAVNDAINSGEVIELAKQIRTVAYWLWQDKVPPFAADIDKPRA